jgi:hypothetical protein
MPTNVAILRQRCAFVYNTTSLCTSPINTINQMSSFISHGTVADTPDVGVPDDSARLPISDCSICLLPVTEAAVLECGVHVYCFECISKWLTKERACPMCKMSTDYIRTGDTLLLLQTVQIFPPGIDGGRYHCMVNTLMCGATCTALFIPLIFISFVLRYLVDIPCVALPLATIFMIIRCALSLSGRWTTQCPTLSGAFYFLALSIQFVDIALLAMTGQCGSSMKKHGETPVVWVASMLRLAWLFVLAVDISRLNFGYAMQHANAVVNRIDRTGLERSVEEVRGTNNEHTE